VSHGFLHFPILTQEWDQMLIGPLVESPGPFSPQQENKPPSRKGLTIGFRRAKRLPYGWILLGLSSPLGIACRLIGQNWRGASL